MCSSAISHTWPGWKVRAWACAFGASSGPRSVRVMVCPVTCRTVVATLPLSRDHLKLGTGLPLPSALSVPVECTSTR